MRVLFVAASAERAAAILDPIGERLRAEGISWSLSTDPDADISPEFRVVYLLSYDRVIRPEILARVDGRVVVFHSSDLPSGRGWAPIYYSMLSGDRVHTISMCYAAEPVDSGNILAKARIPILANYTAPMLRAAGQRMIGQMIVRYTARFAGAKPPGTPQRGPGSYRKRRMPDDAVVDAHKPLLELMPHILASEEPNLAVIEYRGQRFRIQAAPENREISADFTIDEMFEAPEALLDPVDLNGAARPGPA
ncbi:MAG TPA: formyltransferase family protein [Xanthobacteraceae bacterium]|nr:formyltransferase family protein [Xanthobacteraceae bacterium]